ncbi:serine/threonine-protein kinase grp isoform X2 [Cryptotermes secundus]|uniref:serine/threonine-protein kinase grp isoform X2 n=1 Tax=Cryptotermes secundus TaxID=105785 RepID=UPI000CD7B4EF|nr:serine/threonine-protein kinase grp isoform X2 [Cryptotermes secundus]
MDFVAGWQLSRTLGEGSFGKVKLLTHRSSGEQVAMKEIDLEKHSGAQSSIQKEVFIHRMANHRNIIQFYGNHREGHVEYSFLEFLSGGDLFDRIAA